MSTYNKISWYYHVIHTHPMVSTVNLSFVKNKLKNKIKPLVNHIATIR